MTLCEQDGAAENSHIVNLKVAYLPINIVASNIIVELVMEGSVNAPVTIASLAPAMDLECKSVHCSLYVSLSSRSP